jgi:hypothetical protein
LYLKYKSRDAAGQRIDIMELRTLIALKLNKFSNRKVALLLKINRKTIDEYIKRFTELGITYEELFALFPCI